MDNGNNAGRSGYRPSSTNPQCKVCMSPDRFDIEWRSPRVSRKRRSRGGFPKMAGRSADKTSTRTITVTCR